MKTKIYFSKMKAWSKYALLSMGLFLSGNLMADLTDGLKLYYDFNTLEDGVVLDVSGNGNNGLAFGSAVLVDGKEGQGIHLPTAANPAADYVEFPKNIVSDLNSSFSIAAWVKLDADINWGRIFDFGTDGGGVTMFLTGKGDNGRLTFCLAPADRTIERKIHGTSALPVDEWLHVALSVNSEKKAGVLYVNGEEVGRNDDFVCTPADMGETPNNYIGKSMFADAGFNGIIDDFRIYNRALSTDDVWALLGYSAAERQALEKLNGAMAYLNSENGLDAILGDAYSLNEIYGGDKLNLMTSLAAYEGVVLTWESSAPQAIANDGTVGMIEELTLVDLKVTLTHADMPVGSSFEKTYKATVVLDVLPEKIAVWNFGDAVYSTEDGKLVLTSTGTGSTSYKGTYENGASKRTIGEGENSFTVLDLGGENGYFDMGTEVGEVIYQMSSGFSMGGYFLVEESAINPTANGNFLWCFSNSYQSSTDKNGSIFGRPWIPEYSITTGRWDSGDRGGVKKTDYFVNSTEASDGKAAYLGTWHHLFYSQSGTTGTLYVDGVAVGTNEVSVLPAYLRIDGRAGTEYNFLGRSQYEDNGDKYFNGALLYEFAMYGYGLSGDDVNGLQISQMLSKLNAAYAENPGQNTPSNLLDAEQLIDVPVEWLGAVIRPEDNMSLPTGVDGYPEIEVVWTPSNPYLMDENGNIVHHYYDVMLSNLTAKLIDVNTGKSITKEFIVDATVKAGKTVNATENGKLVHFDFDNATIDKVNQFTGTLENNARIRRIGENESTFNVLDLGENNGYFDMGTDIGQVVANLEDNYTIAAYYYIDPSYTSLSSNGNFLWTFSNSANSGSDRNGYFIFSAGQQRVEMTPETYNTAGILNLALEYDDNSNYVSSAQGEWYFVAITGEEGWVEGERVLNYYMYRTDSEKGEVLSLNTSTDLDKTPKSDLLKEGRLGTNYNWIGRSCWSGDVYLRKALVHDFRIYNKGMTANEFEGEEFGDVKATLQALAAAYKANPDNPNSVEKITKESPYQIYAAGKTIKVLGLQGSESIALYDASGRQYRVKNAGDITVDNAGIYILRINNYVAKILVR